MADKRDWRDLQDILEKLLGSKNVYYQPPTNLQMKYDAIRYDLGRIDSRFANDKRYAKMNCYDVILITRLPEPEVLDKILDLPYTSLGKPYKADNLYHYPITIYY